MLRRVVGFLAYAALAVSLFGQTAPPSGTTPDTSKEAVVYERINNLVRFESDGTGVRDSTAVIRVQSQAAIQELGQLIFGYSSASETLNIDYVRVRKPDGQVVETSLANVQDFAPDILREAPMYSDYRQRHVSVANLQPGDVLEYHTITQVRPLAPGEFWYEYEFSKQIVIRNEQLQIDIPKSREVKLKNSPDHPYEMHEAGDRRIYTWTIKDFIPDRKHDQDEEDDSDLEPDVQLSTFTTWEQVARWYSKLQGERVVVDDSVRQKADELSKGATTPTEKTRRLYDYVARDIRYVSLSFGVGRLQPHFASEVLANGYGDCKDKHTLLEALLRAEGIVSYPVLIGSDRKLDPDVPSPAQFDHVITAVPLGKDKAGFTWLDATAEVAPYGLILYQLRNKQALLASGDANAGLIRTPAEVPVKNRMLLALDGRFTETGALDVNIDLTAQGDSDWPLRAVLRRAAQADWQRVVEYLSGAWGFAGDVSDVHLDSLEDTSKPLHLSYHLRRDNYFLVPTSGTSFQLLPAAGRLPARPAGKKSGAEPIDVGPAEERTYRAHIQFPPNFTVHVPDGIQMTSDYGEYSVSYTLNRNVLDAERRVVLKVNELPAHLRTKYESFRTVTNSASEQGLWCSITPASAAAVAAAEKAGGTPDEMQKSAVAALERNDFTTAVDLLKRALAQDAKQKDAWDDLGRAYAGLNQHDQAIDAFRKQIELDPYHQRANQDLAGELQQVGKLDEAIATYRKQTELTPSDKFAHKSLGLLLAQQQHDQEAQSELELAASLPPDDPEVKMALAQVYARTGNKEKSEALMKALTGATSASSADLYAEALRPDVDPNQSLHDARQTLDDLGDQFDSGEYDHFSPSAFSAMNLVALAWAREGWANFLQGETLEAMQYLNSAWLLSQSGTIANRMARALQKEGQREKARHMFALAAAAGGADAQSSRQELAKLSANPADADKEVSQAAAELLQMRTVKLSGGASGSATAKVGLVFDNSDKPERAEYLSGDASLRATAEKLRDQNFPVKFPDVSSIKIVRQGTLSCTGSECSLVLQRLETAQAPAQASTPK